MKTDWAKRVSPYIWLGVMAGVLIGVSILVDSYQYIDLWFLTFIYSVVGYALDVGVDRDRHPKLRSTFLTVSLVLYVVLFTFIRFILLAKPSFPVMD